MRSALFLFLSVCCSFARADQIDLEYLQLMSSNSYLFSSSMLVYFDPDDRTPDPRSLVGAFEKLNRTKTKAVQLGQQPALMTPVMEMERIYLGLERAPRSLSPSYPEKNKQVLQLNQQLQEVINAHYQRALAKTPTPLVDLYAQSQAMAHLLMDYQLRRYPLPPEAKIPFVIPPDQLEPMDKQIQERFVTLLKQFPARENYLSSVRKKYNFVRKQLMQASGRPSGGAEFYIGRAVDDLNDLALELAMEGAGSESQNP